MQLSREALLKAYRQSLRILTQRKRRAITKYLPLRSSRPRNTMS